MAPTHYDMADDTGIEPDMTENRKLRDHEAGASTAKGGDEKADRESSNDGSNAEQVQSGENGEEKKKKKKKQSKLNEMWGKLGLDMPTVMMMFKHVSRFSIDNIG